MKKSIRTLQKYAEIEKLIIHSLDCSLYQASVVIDGEEYSICRDDGRHLSARSILEIQRLCGPLKINTQVLRQDSAYDEMIGGPEKISGNRLEVCLGDNKLY